VQAPERPVIVGASSGRASPQTHTQTHTHTTHLAKLEVEVGLEVVHQGGCARGWVGGVALQNRQGRSIQPWAAHGGHLINTYTSNTNWQLQAPETTAGDNLATQRQQGVLGLDLEQARGRRADTHWSNPSLKLVPRCRCHLTLSDKSNTGSSSKVGRLTSACIV
jgi:hypothetical protein